MDTELRARIEAIELQLRRWKMMTIVVIIAMIVLVLVAAAPPQDNGFVQQFAAPKFAAQSFLLVARWQNIRADVHQGNSASLGVLRFKGRCDLVSTSE